LPHHGLIHLGHGDVEALLQLVFERAHDLATVLEGLGVLDADFEGELGDGHGVTGIYTASVRPFAIAGETFSGEELTC